MAILDFFNADTTDDQPDWRQSVADCLQGDSAACELVSITASALPKDFIGTHIPMTSSAFKTAADILKVSEASIHAVSSVEALGSGYLPSGRPKILFEAHKFSAFTGHKYDASNPNISSKVWNKALYGGGGEHQYVRLAAAIKLNETAALRAASWGAYQILGDNFAACGFPSVQSYVYDQLISEDDQLLAFCHFVKSNASMQKALQKLDWATFAKLYNGPGYAQNAYDKKLAVAFKKFGGK